MPNELTPAEQAAAETLTRQHWTPLASERVARAVVAAVKPHAWREVAEWIRDSCEDGDSPFACERCQDQADVIDDRAAELEEVSNAD